LQININKRTATITIAQAAVMAALVAVATFLVQIPIPATKGYLNFGDIMIFVSALTFGPIIGGFAGGVGSAISDVASGYAYFAPFTLIIKGAEGLIAGLISNRLSRKRDIAAVVIAGIEMVTGYFLAEFFGLSEGWAALGETPFNILQIAVGGIVGISITIILRKRLPEAWRNYKTRQNASTIKS
jgi:uncharacterized membrane protein